MRSRGSFTYRLSLLSFVVNLSKIDNARRHDRGTTSALTFDRWDFFGTRLALGGTAVAVTGFA